MKLGTLRDGQAVAVQGEHYQPLSDRGWSGTVLELIQAGPGALDAVRRAGAGRAFPLPLDLFMLAAPLPRPPKIVAVGLNYRDHAAETNLALPEQPLVFTKFSTSVIGPRDTIDLPLDLTEQTDYEVELAVVIGRTAQHVAGEEALSHVFGYTVVNDLTARDVQFGDGQWARSKSFDTFCPMGPWIVTADKLPRPGSLRLGSTLGGRAMQDSSTDQLVFGVADLISRLSQSFTFEPGDVLITGTPSGVGYTRTPPVFLRPRDEVRAWVEGIGELINPVRARVVRSR